MVLLLTSGIEGWHVVITTEQNSSTCLVALIELQNGDVQVVGIGEERSHI